MTTNTASIENELTFLINKYTNYAECDEWHIHQNNIGLKPNSDKNDGHMEFDEDKLKVALLVCFHRYAATMAREELEKAKKQLITDWQMPEIGKATAALNRYREACGAVIDEQITALASPDGGTK